ncbi:MAG: COX15/CtaA family protein [Deltaproteobacteria bacterium]|nr:COX15/CtaA family protein [Deltaproteobacteria bacterium]
MRIRGTLIGLTLLTYGLIIWGAVVRRAGAGLGCPDWPLCHGAALPPSERLALIEYSHRALAGVVVLLLLWIVVRVFRNRALRAALGGLSVAAFGLLLLQAVLGALAVASELEPLIIATHLALSWLFLALILAMTFRASDSAGVNVGASVAPPRGLLNFGYLALAILVMQAILGALVSTSHAGLACPDFPMCQGMWWPEMHGAVALHMSHRLGALAAFLTLGGFGLLGRRVVASADRFPFRLLLLVLVLQLALGIANIWYALAFAIDVAHLAMATLLYILLIICLWRLRAQRLLATHQAAH